jgi:hypothetical protein
MGCLSPDVRHFLLLLLTLSMTSQQRRQYTLVADGVGGSSNGCTDGQGVRTTPPPVHWLASDGRADGVVVVKATRPVSAMVYVEVDQSRYMHGVA